VVVAESGGADWLLPALEAMEEVHEADNVRDSQIKPHEPIWESLKDGCRVLPRRPSEYVDTNVFVQLHAHARDWSKIDELKPDNLMWGSDFPHAESTWPNSMAYLQEQIDRFDVSIDDVETILARNPAKVYGFDLTKLQTVADRIGPTFDNGAPALR
jgi:predicted TIM-barrel fold metal-dependent hydrolase